MIFISPPPPPPLPLPPPPPSPFFFLLHFIGSTGVWTWTLMLARQAFYLLSRSASHTQFFLTRAIFL
jgi:hypothetical protein